MNITLVVHQITSAMTFLDFKLIIHTRHQEHAPGHHRLQTISVIDHLPSSIIQ